MRRVLITNFGQSALSTAETLAFQTADIAAHTSQTTPSRTEDLKQSKQESSSESSPSGQLGDSDVPTDYEDDDSLRSQELETVSV
jgi:hypothetical protein